MNTDGLKCAYIYRAPKPCEWTLTLSSFIRFGSLGPEKIGRSNQQKGHLFVALSTDIVEMSKWDAPRSRAATLKFKMSIRAIRNWDEFIVDISLCFHIATRFSLLLFVEMSNQGHIRGAAIGTYTHGTCKTDIVEYSKWKLAMYFNTYRKLTIKDQSLLPPHREQR